MDSTEYIDVSDTDMEEPVSLTSVEINRLADRLVELQDRAEQRFQRFMRLTPDLTSEDVFDQGFGDQREDPVRTNDDNNQAPNSSVEVNTSQANRDDHDNQENNNNENYHPLNVVISPREFIPSEQFPEKITHLESFLIRGENLRARI